MATFKRKKCATCGKTFQPNTSRSKYCSEECRRGTGVCIICGKTFLLTKPTTGRYCSLECWYKDTAPGRRPNHGPKRKPLEIPNCLHCGKELEWRKGRKRKFCSRKCAVTANNMKRGLTAPFGTLKMTAEGYVIMKVGTNHPGSQKNGWILQHRYVMQESLGRPLRDDERVHHRNAIRTDNRIENLQVWYSVHPAGVTDDE